MSVRKVIGYRKLLDLSSQESYGIIQLQLKGTSSKPKFELNVIEFLTLSHILENDIVFYDSSNKYFFTDPDRSIGEPIQPRV